MARRVFMSRLRMKDLLLRARVVVKTSNMKISHVVFWRLQRNIAPKACCTCSTIILPYSTNEIVEFWRCRCRCRREVLNSLLNYQPWSSSVGFFSCLFLSLLPPCRTNFFVAALTIFFFVISCGRCRNEPSEGLQRKS